MPVRRMDVVIEPALADKTTHPPDVTDYVLAAVMRGIQDINIIGPDRASALSSGPCEVEFDFASDLHYACGCGEWLVEHDAADSAADGDWEDAGGSEEVQKANATGRSQRAQRTPSHAQPYSKRQLHFLDVVVSTGGQLCTQRELADGQERFRRFNIDVVHSACVACS